MSDSDFAAREAALDRINDDPEWAQQAYGAMNEEEKSLVDVVDMRELTDQTPSTRCGRCLRFSFAEPPGRECRMPQPDGGPCGGIFRYCTTADLLEYEA